MRAASLAGLFVGAHAASLPLSSSYGIKEVHHVPKSWQRVGSAPGDHVIDLHIGLKQSRFDELEQQLWTISDPSHSKYGQHLSLQQINELVKPSDASLNAVLQWLSESAGVTHQDLKFSPSNDIITLSLPVETIEHMLKTKYYVYQHSKEGHFIIRTPQWSLPLHLHEHIDTVQPTTNFMRPAAQARTLKPVGVRGKWAALPYKAHYSSSAYPDVSQVCNASAITPACLRTLYGTIDYIPRAADRNKIALTNYLGETQARGDVRKFLQKYRPEAAISADAFQNIINDNGAADTEDLNKTQILAELGLEGSLDAETIIGMTFPTPLITYSTGGSPPFKADAWTVENTNEPYLVWLQYMLGLPDAELPYSVSTSYGDDEQTVPLSYARKVCSMFAQLGARGVTLLVSSGDNGVGPNGSCISNDGKDKTMFLPSFPASCPYVTTVGGTMDFAPEVAAFDARNGYAGGGGFSNYFPAPPYQAAVAKQYIKSLKGEFDGFYNKSGRGYPDIAAQSVSYAVTWGGSEQYLDGTSAACPTAASVISLLNDARLAAGQKPLGFLNPLLYQSLHQGFHDVTNGSAVGCSEVGNPQGFPAMVGWDAVTGWGTPNFPVLREAVVQTGGFIDDCA